MKLVHLVGFITKKFVTMHGHMNVKCIKGVLGNVTEKVTNPAKIEFHNLCLQRAERKKNVRSSVYDCTVTS
jgi:hypothetical protein